MKTSRWIRSRYLRARLAWVRSAWPGRCRRAGALLRLGRLEAKAGLRESRVEWGKAPRRVRRSLVVAAIAGALLPALLTAWLLRKDSLPEDLERFAASGRRPVELAPVEVTDLEESFVTYASLLPIREALLKPVPQSMVRRLAFRPGQPVRMGQAIALLSSEVTELKRDLESIELETKRLDFDVSASLAQREFISQNEFRQKELEFRSVKARKRLQEIEHASALVAPFSGVVGDLNIYAGQYIDANTAQTAYVRVIDKSAFRIELSLPMQVAKRLREGGKASVRVEGGRAVEARLSSVSATVDPKSGSVYGELLVTSPDPQWIAGMFAEVRLQVEKVEDAFAVPLSAVVQEKGQAFVYRLQPEGRAPASLAESEGAGPRVEKVAVSLGVRGEELVEIRPVTEDALDELDRIVVRGQGNLSHLAAVEVLEKK